MAKQSQKTSSGSMVRIWGEPKKRLQKVVEKKSEKEGRIVSEAELVSKAVNTLCDREEKKLGLA